MPVMDGIQVLRTIKQLDSNAKVIMCSAMGQEGMVVGSDKTRRAGFYSKAV